MRKMKLAMLIVFCVMLFGGTVVSFVLPDREFSDVENRELAKKPKITAKRILSGEYQKEYDTYLSDQFFFRDKWVDLAVREQIALRKKDFNGVYLGKNNYLLEKYEKADFDSGQIKENETYLTTFLNETEKRYGRKHVRAMFVPSKTTALTNVLPAYADTIDWHQGHAVKRYHGHGQALSTVHSGKQQSVSHRIAVRFFRSIGFLKFVSSFTAHTPRRTAHGS